MRVCGTIWLSGNIASKKKQFSIVCSVSSRENSYSGTYSKPNTNEKFIITHLPTFSDWLCLGTN